MLWKANVNVKIDYHAKRAYVDGYLKVEIILEMVNGHSDLRFYTIKVDYTYFSQL